MASSQARKLAIFAQNLIAGVTGGEPPNVTSASDPTFADNSIKPASTGWVRAAMSAIAVASGFVLSSGAPGYIKFPSWLGGLIIQWGNGSPAANNVAQTLTFPIAFPNGNFGTIATVAGAAAYANGVLATVTTNTQVTLYNASTSGSQTCRWFAFGY